MSTLLREKLRQARAITMSAAEVEGLREAAADYGSPAAFCSASRLALAEVFGPDAVPAAFAADERPPTPERRKQILGMSELGKAVLAAEDRAAKVREAGPSPAAFSAPAPVVDGVGRSRLDALLDKGPVGRHLLASRTKAARPA